MVMKQKCLVLFFAAIAAFTLPGTGQAEPDWHFSTIQSPEFREVLTSLPVEIVLVFEDDAEPDTLEAWLNNTNITHKFEPTADGMRAFVGIEDGIIVATDPKSGSGGGRRSVLTGDGRRRRGGRQVDEEQSASSWTSTSTEEVSAQILGSTTGRNLLMTKVSDALSHTDVDYQKFYVRLGTADADSDGILDAEDNCPYTPNAEQVDADSDGAGDVCDNCPNDPFKLDPGICGCGVVDTDSDSDGTADCDDLCPADPNKIAPGVCGCGVPDDDTDGDGTPDCDDLCPTDPGKTEPGICGCGTPDDDSDSDGTVDCNDLCPEDPNKIDPGVCGCGVSDADLDSDGEPDCDDLCPDDPFKTDPGICGCGVPDDDSDSDGTADCDDNCPADPNKIEPGICGCGVSDADSDSDGTADCNDLCPEDPNKIDPGVCGCGILDTDLDSDGEPDCDDLCPDDPLKTDPGICGCGVPDDDSDSDGTADCNDNCPADPNKIEPGICGCGNPDDDSDSDGTADCEDNCPADPNKTEPGVCGCGVPDADSDSDGTPDCIDNCPADPNKIEPGICGCGVSDDDSDSDGTPDCIDTGDPPVADAGLDNEYFVSPGGSTEVQLNGAGSYDPDGSVTAYTWTGTPDPDDIAQPTVTLFAGQHTFTLVVTDDEDNDSAPDNCTVTVTESAENLPPDITSTPLTSASVDYEYVYPVFANDPNSDPLAWALLANPEGMTVDTAGVIRWTPTEEQLGDYPVSVQVDDGQGGTDSQTYWVRVTAANSAAGNLAPIANAGDEQTVDEGDDVTLDGTYSFDADGDHLQFHWTQLEGPVVALDNQYAPQPVFTTPLVDGVTTLEFELIVNDGSVESAPATARVTILNLEILPEGMVTNTNDSGPGSLRAAVEYANAHPGTRITFAIPDTDPGYDADLGVWSMSSPQINPYWWIYISGDGTFLDGTTQTENYGDRNPYGPEIQISGGSTSFSVAADDVVIRGFTLNGTGGSNATVSVLGGDNIVISGNYIGTDPTGTQARNQSNCSAPIIYPRDGIRIIPNPVWGGQVGHVRIGGTGEGEGNLISGMAIYAIAMWANVGTVLWSEGDIEIESVTIQGNLIGTERTGTVSLVDCGGISASRGILSEFHRADLLIGGITPGSRNIISGWSIGIWATGVGGRTRIQGNYIGTDISGTFAVPPTASSTYGIGVSLSHGLEDFPAEHMLIGGGEPGAGNLISGNAGDGLAIQDSRKYLGQIDVQGNLIGTDVTGTSAIPNQGNGVALGEGASVQVGGFEPGEGNVIAGNEGWGIWQRDNWRAPYSRVRNNKIGLAADGVTALGNGDGGIYVGMDSGGILGGFEEGAGNIIVYNDGPGIYFPGWWNDQYTAYRRGRPLILGNSIHSNNGLGIARAGTVQDNDAGDANLATYHLQNFPVITEVTVENGMTRVVGNLDTLKPHYCMCELFANTTVDPSGCGEGERWLVSFYPDEAGNFEVTIPENLSGSYLTATATRWIRDEGDPSARSSEFSQAVLVGDAVDSNLPPSISSSPLTSIIAEDLYAYQVVASDPESADLTYAFAMAPDGMSISATGLINWVPTTAQEGRNVVTVIVRDDIGLLASQNFTINVLPLIDLEPPIISIPIPLGLTIEAPYELIGTVMDDYLVNYVIEMAHQGVDNWFLMDEGADNVLNDLVGVVDSTRLANGVYDLRVTAIDEGGLVTVFNSSLEVTGRLKVGQFSLAFQDIMVPVSGLPISVIRSYNSFDKEQGDFGVGWDMTLASGVKLQTTRSPLGADWYAEEDYFFDPGGTGTGAWVYALETYNIPKVLITYADGTQDRFEFRPDFVTQPAFDPRYVLPYFVALPGTTSTLEAIADNDLILYPWPAYPDGEDLLDTDFEVYDPDLFRLTTAEGMELMISKTGGLQSITDRNGNTVTFTPDGIAHSAGLDIDFLRDGEGRITQITDPDGGSIGYAYDGNGDLTGFTDQAGGLTQFGYDDLHNLLSIIDPNGVEVLQTEYDEQGRLIGTTDALGNVMSLLHDTGNAVEYITDALGNTTAYTYDGDGNVIAVTDPDGNVTGYSWDADGNKLSETDPLGNTTTWTYDAAGNVLSQTDPLGNTTLWSYNDYNQPLTITAPLGNVTVLEYGASGNLTSKTDPLGNTMTYAYDASGNMTSATDCEGNVTSYTYDSFGRRISETDALGNETTYTYDNNGNLLTMTSSRTTGSGVVDMTTAMAYDSLGRLTQTTYPDGSVTSSQYNDAGQKTADLDPLGNITTYGYDGNGRRILTSHPDGTEDAESYDANGNRITSTDRAGNVTQYLYDALRYEYGSQSTRNRLVAVIHPDGNSSEIVYDAAGRIATNIDENDHSTTSAYDAAGRRTSVTDALGNVTTFTYDANGNQLSVTDPNGNTTSFQYDALGRRTTTLFPDGSSSSTVYASGCGAARPLSRTDQAGNTTSFEYDALKRLTRTTDALGNQINYGYDEVGNQLTLTDPNGNSTSWEYDDMGRAISRTLPVGMAETFTYDAAGRLVSKTAFNGDTVTFSYDSMGRLVSKGYPDTSSVTYAYTSSGRRASVTDGSGTISYTYDTRGRLTSVTHPSSAVISYSYDAAGNRTSVTAPSGTTSYAYDALNRPTAVTDAWAGSTAYTYDAAGNRIGMSYPNGTTAEYSYNSLNRLTNLVNRNSSSAVISSYAYTLGPAGNRTQVVEGSGRSVDYGYDNLYRLIQETISEAGGGGDTISYTYDAFGNRLTRNDTGGNTSYTYDANNRLVTEAAPGYTNTYAHDANGNIATRSDGTTTTTYGHDYDNRLVSVQTGASLAEYGYDPDGARILSIVDGTETRYLVDKNRGHAQVLDELNGSGAVTVSYAHGADLIGMNRGGSISYPLYDGQLSTRMLIDPTQAVTDEYAYDAFGIMLHSTGTTPNNYLYTGEQYDPGSGMYYLRARYYDQSVGRFHSMDTYGGSGFDPPSLHRYLYTNNNAVNFVDPSGHFGSLIEINVAQATQNVLRSMRQAYHGTLKGIVKDSYPIMYGMIEPAYCMQSLGLHMVADDIAGGGILYRDGRALQSRAFFLLGNTMLSNAQDTVIDIIKQNSIGRSQVLQEVADLIAADPGSVTVGSVLTDQAAKVKIVGYIFTALKFKQKFEQFALSVPRSPTPFSVCEATISEYFKDVQGWFDSNGGPGSGNGGPGSGGPGSGGPGSGNGGPGSGGPGSGGPGSGGPGSGGPGGGGVNQLIQHILQMIRKAEW
jgi:RHS repeat-associated protein